PRSDVLPREIGAARAVSYDDGRLADRRRAAHQDSLPIALGPLTGAGAIELLSVELVGPRSSVQPGVHEPSGAVGCDGGVHLATGGAADCGGPDVGARTRQSGRAGGVRGEDDDPARAVATHAPSLDTGLFHRRKPPASSRSTSLLLATKTPPAPSLTSPPPFPNRLPVGTH